MTTKTNKNFEIISSQEKVKSTKDQMIESIKLNMLEDLKVDKKMVKRNEQVQIVSQKMENITEDKFPIEIDVLGKKMSIKRNGMFKDILNKYIQAKNNETVQGFEGIDQEKIIQQLNKELTEELILQANKMIEFSTTEDYEGKTAEREAKESFERLEKDEKKYGGKIELIKKTNGEETHFIIKRTKKQLDEIARIETAYEETHETIDETTDEKKKNIEKLKTKLEELEEIKLKLKELGVEESKEVNEKINEIREEIKKIEEATGENLAKNREIPNTTLLINRDNLANHIKTKRQGKEFPTGSIEIREGENINIEEQEYFHDFKNKYIEAGQNDIRLKKLDTEFAERIILDNPKNEKNKEKKYYIQINNPNNKKTEAELEAESLRCKDSLKNLGYNVEYISYKNDNGDINHIIRQRDYEPIPEEDNLELNAVISDMGTDVHRERVSLETEEELKERYKGLARYNMPARAYLFLSRGAKRKKIIKDKMKAMAGKAFSDTGDMTKDNTLNEKTGDASDRHELELQHSLDKVAKANTVTLQNPLVNDICKQYLNDTINEDQFQKQFNAIVDSDANIQAVLKGQKITHIGTNILEKLRQQRAKTALIELVDKEINLYLSDGNQSHIDFINQSITAHIKYNQNNLAFMKDYEDFLNKTPGAINKLQTYLRHQKSIMQMQTNNVKMNIDILIKGKSAYQIDNKDRQKGLKYKIGNTLDKLPRWVQTAGFIGLSVGTGLVTGGLGTVAAAAITTGVVASSVGGMNALKKRTHFTKEQNTHEKNVVTDYRNEQKKIAERQNNALNGKRYQWKTYKSKRQLALYDQTTQENIQISDSISDTITDLSSKIGGLDAKENNYMKKNLIQGRVRLKYYRENGHNFLASNEKEQIEKDMKRLEKSLVLGVGKLGKTLTDIETMQATDDLGTNLTYDTVKKDLENSYNKSLIQFKKERRILAVKYGIGTAALSAGMSIGMQYAMGTGIFGGEKINGIDPKSLGVKTHEEFVLGKAELLDTGTKNNIYNTGTKVFGMNNLPDGSTITLDYGAGTNLVPVTPGNLTQSMYDVKIQEVMRNINGLKLDFGDKTKIMTELAKQPWRADWAGTNFTNDYLQGMRCAETIEQGAKALADSGSKAYFNLNYNTAMTTTTEKITNASFNIETPGIPGKDGSTRGRFLQFPVFFNTFKDVKGKEKEEEKKKKSNTIT